MRILSLMLLALISILLSPLTLADRGERKQIFGDYEVHYMALNSTFLTPEVAEGYDIDRSGALAYLSISVLKKGKPDELPQAVTAEVKGQLRNLIGQSKALDFREIKETNAVYYISTFRFDDGDMYNLTLQVTPTGQARTYDVKFSQRLYQE